MKNILNIDFIKMIISEEICNRIIDIPFKQYTGCYLLYLGEELVYVGVACDIAVRLWQHRYKKGKHWDSVKYIEESDYLNAIKIEDYFIDNFSPKYNVRGSSKFATAQQSFGVRFDENLIPYPSGWHKKWSE